MRKPRSICARCASRTKELCSALGEGDLCRLGSANWHRRFSAGEAIHVEGEVALRGFVIERLMCDLTFPAAELNRRFGAATTPLLEEAQALIEADHDRLIEPDGAAFRVTERGRPFVRAIAACFDSYLGTKATRHSAGV